MWGNGSGGFECTRITGPTGRVTVRLAIFPVRAKSGCLKLSNHPITSCGSEFVNRSPTWPLMCCKQGIRIKNAEDHRCELEIVYVDLGDVLLLVSFPVPSPSQLLFQKISVLNCVIFMSDANRLRQSKSTRSFHSFRTVLRWVLRIMPTENT